MGFSFTMRKLRSSDFTKCEQWERAPSSSSIRSLGSKLCGFVTKLAITSPTGPTVFTESNAFATNLRITCLPPTELQALASRSWSQDRWILSRLPFLTTRSSTLSLAILTSFSSTRRAAISFSGFSSSIRSSLASPLPSHLFIITKIITMGKWNLVMSTSRL